MCRVVSVYLKILTKKRLFCTADVVRFVKENQAKDADKSKGGKVTKKQHVAPVEDEEAEAEDSQEEGAWHACRCSALLRAWVYPSPA